jgi:hypothetical protein
MKNAPAQNSNEGAHDSANSNIKKKFTGTDNPRELRAIHALMTRPQPREHLDRAVGCSNAPDLVSRLRDKGLEVPCLKIDYIDRDGKITHPGIYHFNDADRRKVNSWLHQRGAR